MKIFLPALALLTLLLSVTSCKKNANPEPQVSKTDHLTASLWKIDDFGPDQNRDDKIDASALGFFTCLQDNTILFKRDNTGTTDEGVSKCNTTDPQTTAITWSFTDAETHINVTNSNIGAINGKSRIIELSATTLILSKDTTLMGFPGPFIVKVKH